MGAVAVIRGCSGGWDGAGGVADTPGGPWGCCCQGDRDDDAGPSPRGAPARSRGWGRCHRQFLQEPGANPRGGLGGALTGPPTSHLRVGLRQRGPPWCRGGSSGTSCPGPSGLAWPGGHRDRGPSPAPVLGSQCPRGRGPTRLGCGCQESGCWRGGEEGCFCCPHPFLLLPLLPQRWGIGEGDFGDGGGAPALRSTAQGCLLPPGPVRPPRPGPAAPNPAERAAKPGRAPGPRCQAGPVCYR